jgi:hypothetical protein
MVDNNKLQARYKELIAPRLKEEEKEIKALNDRFMNGKLSLTERLKAADKIYAKTNAVANKIRAKLLKGRK